MPKNQTQKLAQGAIMVLFFTVLIAISIYIPALIILTVWFVSLPVAWYSAMYDRRSSVQVVIISIVMTILVGGVMVLPLSILCGFAGFAIGDALRRRKSKVFLFMSTGFTVLISTALTYVMSVKLLEIDILKIGMIVFQKSYEKSNEIAKSMPGGNALTTEQLEQMFNLVEMVRPTIITMAVFIMTFLVILVNLPLLRRTGIAVPKFAPFKDLRLPRPVLWYYMIVLIVTLFIKPEIGTFANMVFLNLSFMLSTLLLLQGISFIHFFMYKKGWPKWTALIGTILAMPLYSFVTLIGIVDLGFNIRALVTGMPRK